MSLRSRTCPGRIAVAIGIALALFIAPSANATHKTDHRYTVSGEIKYEDNTPAAEVVVKLLVKDGEPMAEVKTDYRGRYRIVLHIHNQDIYKVFDMRVNNVARRVQILFNPNDHQTERSQRVDLIVKRKAQYETSAVPTE